ncbi:MAG: hypothetical protein WCI01_07205 [Chlorobiaceae bacterium]
MLALPCLCIADGMSAGVLFALTGGEGGQKAGLSGRCGAAALLFEDAKWRNAPVAGLKHFLIF